jgi:hypothetical protein
MHALPQYNTPTSNIIRAGLEQRACRHLSRAPQLRPRSEGGLTNSVHFAEIWWFEFKMCQITVNKLKKSKIKKIKKYVKKLDEILRLLVKKFFQISIVWLVKI